MDGTTAIEATKNTDVKKIERISKLQKQKLVNYMSSNLEFARGQFAGINANSNYKEQWESLRISLNSLGSGKTVDQWKKCWIDLKLGVKKTINSRRKFMNRTGGGSWADVPRDLNPLEEQILQIMTVDAVDGDACTPESAIQLEEQLEEFESIEFLEEEEESLATPNKKTKKQLNSCKDLNTTTSFKLLQGAKLPLLPTPKSTSKYLDALEEARNMQKTLIDKLNTIEKQNIEILVKLDKIMGTNSPSLL